jgi:glycine/D-amino acid oxidase-like deaminating enzyme
MAARAAHRGSFWQATAPRTAYPRLAADRQADAVVVGGGITGVCAAYELARAGAVTVLLERARVGSGAGGRNGGQALPGVDPPLTEVADSYGADTARAVDAWAAMALRALERLVEVEGIDCDWERCGHLEAAVTEADLDALAAEQELLSADSPCRGKLLDRTAMAALTGSAFYAGGLWQPAGRGLHPLRYVQGVAAAARRRGAAVFERSPVTSIRRRRGAGFEVTVRGGARVVCRSVILATDAYTPRFASDLRGRLARVEAEIVATAPMERAQARAILPGRATVSDTKTPIYYFRRTADGRLLFGHGGAGDAAIGEVYPQLAGIAIDYRWRGRIGVAGDGLPRLGRTAQGWLYALGYSGQGVVLATGAGLALAEAVVRGDRRADLGPLADLPPVPRPRLHRRAWRPGTGT